MKITYEQTAAQKEMHDTLLGLNKIIALTLTTIVLYMLSDIERRLSYCAAVVAANCLTYIVVQVVSLASRSIDPASIEWASGKSDELYVKVQAAKNVDGQKEAINEKTIIFEFKKNQKTWVTMKKTLKEENIKEVHASSYALYDATKGQLYIPSHTDIKELEEAQKAKIEYRNQAVNL